MKGEVYLKCAYGLYKTVILAIKMETLVICLIKLKDLLK